MARVHTAGLRQKLEGETKSFPRQVSERDTQLLRRVCVCMIRYAKHMCTEGSFRFNMEPIDFCDVFARKLSYTAQGLNQR